MPRPFVLLQIHCPTMWSQCRKGTGSRRALNLSKFILVLSSLLGLAQQSFSLPLITGKEIKISPTNQTNTSQQKRLRENHSENPQENSQEKPWLVEWNLEISGGESKWATRATTRGEFSSNIKARYRPSSIIELNMHPVLRFETGSKSAFSTDESLNANYEQVDAKRSEPANLRLLQASVKLNALDYASAELGILEQDHFLTDRLGWLGGRGRAGYLTGPYQGFLYGEQMIVSTLNYSSQLQEVDKTPALHRAGIEGKISISGLLDARIGAGKFSFVELPDAIATESAFRGNLVDSTSMGHYQFKSQFEGSELFAQVSVLVIPSIRLYMDGDYITNDSAHDDHGHGWRAKTGAEFGVTQNIRTSVDYTQFMIEPDARLSAFASLGTNIVGSRIANYWNFRKEKLRVGIAAIESEPIYKMPLMEENRQIWLTVETDYAKIF